MELQQKLQQLKEMHAKGLITSSVYEEQQKTLLSRPLTGPLLEPAPPPIPTRSKETTEKGSLTSAAAYARG